jgi:hypothetical protein
MKRLVAEDVPAIVQDQRKDVYAVNRDLKKFYPNEIAAFDNLMDVNI